MEKKVVRGAAAVMLALTILFSFVLLNFPDLHVFALQKQLEYSTRIGHGDSVLALMREETSVLMESSKTTKMLGQLRLELPGDIHEDDIAIENHYIDQTVQIKIPGIGESYFFDYPMIGSSDHIDDIIYEVENDEGVIDIMLDQVYELDLTVQESYIYIDFIDPHERYDKIVVIDAGHGGSDPGAMKQKISEKDIDLAIVRKMMALFEASDANIGVYYTRTDDSNPSLEQRVQLANLLQADLFLSVYNNSTASGRMSGIHGTEVMYRVSDESGKSKAFAQNCLDALLWNLGSQSKGVVAGDEIYIVRTAQMPVALAEIGFMTNQEELDLLNSEEYQQRAAQALYDAMIKTLEDENGE